MSVWKFTYTGAHFIQKDIEITTAKKNEQRVIDHTRKAQLFATIKQAVDIAYALPTDEFSKTFTIPISTTQDDVNICVYDLEKYKDFIDLIAKENGFDMFMQDKDRIIMFTPTAISNHFSP